jgi:radical SAM protein with 4Fe4S-binding SPASM domain
MGTGKKTGDLTLSEHFLDSKNMSLWYKAKAFAGILTTQTFVGPYFATVGDRYQCNYRCVFCEWFSPLVKKKRPQVSGLDYLSVDVYQKLVSQLSALGTKVILIGNIEEPFLDTTLIEKIRYTKANNLQCFVITNGSLLTPKNTEQLVDLGLDYLNISLNAGCPQTYPKIHTTETEATYHQIVAMVTHIEALKAAKHTPFPRIRLSMVVCNRNYQDILQFIEIAHRTGVKNVQIKRFISVTKEILDELELTPQQEEETKQYIQQALTIAKKHNIHLDMEWSEWTGAQKTPTEAHMPCYFGWLFCVIDADGNLYPCCFQERTPNALIGNIAETNFKTLWKSEKYQTFRKQSKNIAARRQLGYLCNQPSCFYNNKQVHDTIHNLHLRLSKRK